MSFRNSSSFISNHPQPLHQIPFTIISCSSKDTSFSYPFFWMSQKFCLFPQEILIRFAFPAEILQVNMLIHEKKIPSKIEFVNCIEKENGDKKDMFKSYEEIGYVKLSCNANNNYNARELRKIYMKNIKSRYMKLIIHRNYANIYNIFCQVGIVSLQFFGKSLEQKPINNKVDFNPDTSMQSLDGINLSDTLCQYANTADISELGLDESGMKRLNFLKSILLKNKKEEDFDKCKVIKNEIDRFSGLVRRIFILENKKKTLIDSDDFDDAKKVKTILDRLKLKMSQYLNNCKNDTSYSPMKDEENVVNNSINQITNNNENSGILNKSVLSSKLNISKKLIHSHSQPDFGNENFVNYDDIILPTILRKMQNNKNVNVDNSCTLDEMMDEDMENYNSRIEPLEALNNENLNKFETFLRFINEEELRKVLSCRVLYRDEGIDILKMKIGDILNFENPNNLSNMNNSNNESLISNSKDICKNILLLMELIDNYLEDSHPTIKHKTLELFKLIIENISNNEKINSVLKFDYIINKSIIKKIINQLKDISAKVREKAIETYTYLIESNYGDFNALLIELIEKDVICHIAKSYGKNSVLRGIKKKNIIFINENISNINKKSIRNNNKFMLYSKLIIVKNILLNINNLYDTNRTKQNTFPSHLVASFLVINLISIYPEIRKLSKELVPSFIDIFGTESIKSKLKNLHPKELMNIINDLPTLKELFINDSDTLGNIINIPNTSRI